LFYFSKPAGKETQPSVLNLKKCETEIGNVETLQGSKTILNELINTETLENTNLEVSQLC